MPLRVQRVSFHQLLNPFPDRGLHMATSNEVLAVMLNTRALE
jgi:hypothetical protein